MWSGALESSPHGASFGAHEFTVLRLALERARPARVDVGHFGIAIYVLVIGDVEKIGEEVGAWLVPFDATRDGASNERNGGGCFLRRCGR